MILDIFIGCSKCIYDNDFRSINIFIIVFDDIFGMVKELKFFSFVYLFNIVSG